MKIKILDRQKIENGHIKESIALYPFNINESLNFANFIRRTFLNNYFTYKIVGINIKSISNEFATSSLIKEDILEVIQNLKEIVFITFGEKKPYYIGKIIVNGPKIVTSNNIIVENDSNILLLTKNKYICSITQNLPLEIEFIISNSSMSSFISEVELKKYIQIDQIFNTIKQFSFETHLINDSYGSIKEYLILNIISDGSITPSHLLTYTFINHIKRLLSFFI